MLTTIMPHTPEWHEARRQHVTATDVARIMAGRNGQTEARTVYEEKIGAIPSFAGNEYTETGTIMEPAVLQLYAHFEDGCRLEYPLPLALDADCPALAASPDAQRLDKPIGVEAKWSISPKLSEQIGEDDSDFIPEPFIWQGQSQLACMPEWEEVHFALILFGRRRRFRVARNATLVNQCRTTAEWMAKCVRDRTPPPWNFDSPNEQASVKSLYRPQDGKILELGDDALGIVAAYQAAGARKTAAEKEQKAADAQLRTLLDGASHATLPDGGSIKFGTVEVAERIQASYQYSRLWISKPKKK